jgi:hypothetical protein
VLVDDAAKLARIKVCGRATFSVSADFRSLVRRLHQLGYERFLMELDACPLMDSTFLGVLAGFGVQRSSPGDPPGKIKIELHNPNPRIKELLESLGVMDFYPIVDGVPTPPADVFTPVPETNPDQLERAQVSLEAHDALAALNPENAERFKDVALFLQEDIKRLEEEHKGKSE